jgi:hypothetical protein
MNAIRNLRDAERNGGKESILILIVNQVEPQIKQIRA